MKIAALRRCFVLFQFAFFPAAFAIIGYFLYDAILDRGVFSVLWQSTFLLIMSHQFVDFIETEIHYRRERRKIQKALDIVLTEMKNEPDDQRRPT